MKAVVIDTVMTVPNQRSTASHFDMWMQLEDIKKVYSLLRDENTNKNPPIVQLHELYVRIQFSGWDLSLHKDGTWSFEEQEGG